MATPTAHLPSQQVQLEVAVKELFNGYDVHINTRKKTAITNPTTGHPLELDIWVASFDISFEFQDSYHYMTTWYSQVPLNDIQTRDSSKRQIVRNRGSTLLEVPCWWDCSNESLLATILFQRPDLLHHFPLLLSTRSVECHPISLNPPQEFMLAYGYVPDVGALMLASFPPFSIQVGKILSTTVNHWWLGEKYDGVLCCWHSRKRVLYSRAGIPLTIPPPLQRQLITTTTTTTTTTMLGPHHRGPTFLCCELWCGRGDFVATQQIVNSSVDFDWSTLRLLAFDDPTPGINFRPFEERYCSLLHAVHLAHPCVIVVGRVLCTTAEMLQNALNQILRDQGEGVVLRRPGSLYLPGRSDHLIKLKASRADREALVVQVEPSGTVVLQLPTGIVFTVPQGPTRIQQHIPEDEEDEPIPSELFRKDTEAKVNKSTPLKGENIRVKAERGQLKVGDIVTCAYDHVDRNGAPIDLQITRVRKDLNWSQVLISNGYAPQTLDSTSQKVFGAPVKPEGFWRTKKAQNLRKVFEKFACDHNFEPLLPQSWYPFSRPEFVKVPGGAAVLSYFEGSLTRALVALFPEVSFDESKFAVVPRSFWKQLKNRKFIFDSFARENSFDPLVSENWYSVSHNAVSSTKGVLSILQFYYGNNLKKALLHIYPNIGLEKDKFVGRNNWTEIENRKSFLIEFGKAKGFDPLVASNWQHVAPSSLKETAKLLQYYKGNLTTALNHLLGETIK